MHLRTILTILESRYVSVWRCSAENDYKSDDIKLSISSWIDRILLNEYEVDYTICKIFLEPKLSPQAPICFWVILEFE